MVEDMVQLCVDPIFPPPTTWSAPPARDGPMQSSTSPQRRRRSTSPSSEEAAAATASSSGSPSAAAASEPVGRGWFDPIWSEVDGFDPDPVLLAARDLEWYYPTGVPNGLRAPPQRQAPSHGVARPDRARDRAAGHGRPPRRERGHRARSSTSAAAAAAAAATVSDGGASAGGDTLPDSARDCATSIEAESQAPLSDEDRGPQPPPCGDARVSRRVRQRRRHAPAGRDGSDSAGAGDAVAAGGADGRPHSALAPPASSRGVAPIAPPKSPRARAARAAKQLRRALHQITAPGCGPCDGGRPCGGGGGGGTGEEDVSAEQAVFAPALSLLRARVVPRSRHGLLDAAARIEAHVTRQSAEDATPPAAGAPQSGILRSLSTLAEAVEDPAALHAAVDAGALPALWLLVAPAAPCSTAVQHRSASTLVALEARMRGLHRRTHWSDLLPALSAVVQAAARAHASGPGPDTSPLPPDMGARLQEAALAELAQLYRTSRAHGSRELGAALARSGALLVAASCAVPGCPVPGEDGPGVAQAPSLQAQRHARAILRRAPLRELEKVTGAKLPVLPAGAAWGPSTPGDDNDGPVAAEDSWGHAVQGALGPLPEARQGAAASAVAWGDQAGPPTSREPGLLLPPPRSRTGLAGGGREVGPGPRRSASRVVLATSPIQSPTVTPRGDDGEYGPSRLPCIGSQPAVPRDAGPGSSTPGNPVGGALPAIRALGSGELATVEQSSATSTNAEIWPLPPRRGALADVDTKRLQAPGEGARVQRPGHGQRCSSASGRGSPAEGVPVGEAREPDARHRVPRRPSSVRASPCQAEPPPLRPTQSWHTGANGVATGGADDASAGEASLDTAAATGNKQQVLDRAPDWLRTLRSEAALLEAGGALREELDRRAGARQRERWEAAQAEAEKRREAERRNGSLNYEAWCAAVAERERLMKEQQDAEAEAQRQRREEEEAERRAKEAALAARRAELQREHRDQERRREEERQQKVRLCPPPTPLWLTGAPLPHSLASVAGGGASHGQGPDAAGSRVRGGVGTAQEGGDPAGGGAEGGTAGAAAQ